LAFAILGWFATRTTLSNKETLSMKVYISPVSDRIGLRSCARIAVICALLILTGSSSFAQVKTKRTVHGSSIVPVPATVTWSAPQNINGDTDVSLNGTFVAADNVAGSATTVNGVTFSGLTDFSINPATTSDGYFSLSGTNGPYSGYGSPATPFANLSAEYQALLSTGNFGFGNSVMTLTLNNLQVAQTYLVQIFFNDSRGVTGLQTMNVTAGNTVKLNGNTTGANGGTGQFVIGTFIATSTTQSIDIQGDPGFGTLVNGFQLRLNPAITTAATVSVSGRVLTPDGVGLRHATVVVLDATGRSRTAVTNAFGYYRLDGIEAGTTCAISVSSKRFTFPTRMVRVTDQLTGIDLIADSGR